MSLVGDGGGEEEDLCHVRSGGCSVTHVPSGGWGGEEDLCHVRSGGHSLTYVPSGGWGGEEELCHVRSGGCSVTHVLSGGWERRGGSVSCTQWGTLTHICPQWGMVEEKRSSAMYAVGDAQ